MTDKKHSTDASESSDGSSLTIVDKSDATVRRIELSYDLKNSRKKKSVDKKSASLDTILSAISTSLMTDEEKPRRKRDDLPDPSKAAYADVNRLDKHFQARIGQDTDSNIREFLKATGMSKKEATERAFSLLIELYDYE